MNRGATVLVALLMVTSVVGMAMGVGAATPSTTDAESNTNSQAEAYAGAHVEFEVEGDAVTDYRVGGDEAFSSVAVQSESEADAGADVDLETMTTLESAGLSMAAESQTSAQIESESGATLSAHDNERGSLVVESGGEDQVVQAELAAEAEAENEGDSVRIATDDHEGTFLVVGEGEVTVNSEGDVAAELEGDATLAFRAYDDGERDDSSEYEESLIADGQAAVELYAEERDGETVSDAVTYGEETSAEVSQDSQQELELTVERAVSEGTIAMTTVSDEAVENAEDLEVTVDGEAAVEANSESELEAGLDEEPRYMVAHESEASAEATVYIAFDHFSERTATIDGSGDDSTDDGNGADDSDVDDSDADDSDADDAEDSVPGFGVGIAAVAIAIAGLLARLQN